MAKKNGETIEGEAPVKKAPATSEDRYAQLQAERRELEAELAAIDGKIREAINSGDVAAMDILTARKAELPKLFVSASMAESAARNAIFAAEDAANLKRLREAEAERDRRQSSLLKRKAEVEAELAKMQTDVDEAEIEVSGAYGAITASRELGAAGDAGFKASLAKLAGV